MADDHPNSDKISCNVIQSKPLGQDYHLLTLVAPASYTFFAGQYVRMFFKDLQGEFDRYYSIANAPNPHGHVQFCVQLIDGRVRPILQNLQVGDTQSISPAMGRFRLVQDNRPVLLIAGGSGISPIRSFFFEMTGSLQNPPDRQLHLIFGCRNPGAMPGKEEFLDYQHKYGANVRTWLVAEADVRAPLFKGRVTDVLQDAIIPGARIYICGPAPMITAVRDTLTKMGVDPEDILQDPY